MSVKVRNILHDKEELRRIIIQTTPLWKARLYARHGSRSLLDVLEPSSNNLRLVPDIKVIDSIRKGSKIA